MSQKIEGSMALDGLIQGRLPDDADATRRLNEWVAFMQTLGFRFSLQTSGATFSLLPDNEPASVAALGAQPEQALLQALEQLAEVFEPRERGQLFSTLRSAEYRPGEEVQTVYTIVEGAVRHHSRTVEANTTPPPEPLSVRDRVKLGAMTAGTVVVVLGIALLFPGVRAMFGQVLQTVRPFDADEIKFELGAYERYFKVAIDEKESRQRALVVRLSRTDQFPTTPDQLAKAAEATADSLADRLALEQLIRGHVQAELFDAEGKYVGMVDLRVADLKREKSIGGTIPLPEKTVVKRIVLIP